MHRSHKFAAMAARTRREALKDLAENHVIEASSRITSMCFMQMRNPTVIIIDVSLTHYDVFQRVFLVAL